MLRSSVGPLRLTSDYISDDPRSMADSFAEAFASTFVTSVLPNPFPHQYCNVELSKITFTLQDVVYVLSHLDVGSAMGPDGLHPRLLKACASQLAYPFYRIFQMSLSEGALPSLWKLSHVVPIFKKGSRSEPLNYRPVSLLSITSEPLNYWPVSLLSIPSKCLERFISQELHNFLSENSMLTEEQFGFRPGRSTEDQLLLTYNFIALHWDSGHIVDLILYDFSKAFDTVSHQYYCRGFDTLVFEVRS